MLKIGCVGTDEHPSKFKNSPVGLTIIARRLEEEKVTAMLGLMQSLGAPWSSKAKSPRL
jgi:Asp-tRNA(Asn)/Glu-tRNA(Gln) amidotransferase A subunit family amidase